MTHPTRAFSGSIINRFTGSKILARVGQISVAFPALIKIYSYFRLYTFMSIYVKNPADLVYVLSVTMCKTIFDPQRG